LQLKDSSYNISIEMNARTATLARSTPDPSAVLTKAALRAADCLALSQADLSRVLGLSPATVSRLAHGHKRLEPATKSFELAALFVRLFRSLDAIVGSDDAAARAWLRSDNQVLGGVPAELIRDLTGLVRAVDYLDAARARV
jgi:transcriptional regulator with XRE-family HTH domain